MSIATADLNNTSIIPLAASGSFIGIATDVTNYLQINIAIFGRPGINAGDGSSAKASAFFEFSPDGIIWSVSIPTFIRDPSLFIPVPQIYLNRFFRIRYLNDGGVAAITALGLTDTPGTPTTQTTFILTSFLLPLATKDLVRSIDQAIAGSDPAGTVRAILAGKLLSGLYTNVDIKASTPIGNEVGLITRNIPGGVQPITLQSADLAVTATGLTGAAVTATLPLIASKFHVITMIEISAYSTANRGGTLAAPALVTTTNVTGNPIFQFIMAQTGGTIDRLLMMPVMPIKSMVAGIATTFVCPATTSIIWRVNVFYTTIT